MQHIFSNDVGDSFYDEDKHILIYRSKKIIINRKTDLISNLLENTLSLTLDKSIVGEVVDLSGLRGNFMMVLDYLAKDYYTKFKQRGMIKAAYIVSDDIISKNLVGKLCDNNIIETKSFRNMDQAVEWVASG